MGQGLITIVAIAVWVVSGTGLAQTAEPVALQPDQRIELAWAEQDQHRYRLPESLDQPVLVTVEQDGADLKAAARDASGQLLLEVHSTGWYVLNEFIALTADEARGAVIELSEQSRGRQLGRYAISFETIDATALPAWQQLQDGNRYFLAAMPEGSKRPGCGEEAESRWQAARDCYQQVLGSGSNSSAEQRFWAELSVAGSYWEGGDYDDAVERFEVLASSSIPPGLQSGRLGIYLEYALGSTRQNSGDLDGAEQALQTLLDGKLSPDRVPRLSTGLQMLEAYTRNRLCLIDHYRNDLDTAEPCYRSLIDVAEELQDQALQQLLLNNLGGIHFVGGDLRTARVRFVAAQDIAKQLESAPDIARGHSVIGLTHYALDEYPEALERFSAYLGMAEDAGHLSNQASAHYRLANVYRRMGALDRARTHFRSARRLALESGDRSRQSGALYSLALLEIEAGNLSAAEVLLEEDIQLNEDYPLESGPARPGLKLANVYVEQNRFEEASELLTRLRSERTDRWPGWLEALLLESESRLLLGRGEAAEASQKAEQALDLAEITGRPTSLVIVQMLLAEAQYQSGEFGQALASVREARLRFEGMRPDQISLESQAAYSRKQREVYATEISLLMREYYRTRNPDFSVEAFLLAERSKAQSLLVAGAQADSDAVLSATQTEELRRLRDQLNVLSERRYEARWEDPDSDLRRAADERYTRVLNQLEQYESSLGIRSGPIKLPEPDIETLQARIGPDRTLWSFYIGEAGSFYWQLDAQGLRGGAFSSHDELQYQAGLVRQGFTRSNGYRSSTTRDAVAWWAGQLGSRFRLAADIRQLLISADGVLHYLPMKPFIEAMPALKQADREAPELLWISSASAASSAGTNVAAGSESFASAAAVVDPVFSTQDPRMAGSSTKSIETGHGGRGLVSEPGLARLASSAGEIEPLRQNERIELRVLSGHSASRKQILEGALSDESLIHFATHGILDDSGMALSGLALSAFDESGAPRPWLLTAEDISRLNLDARLAVLSACDTAGGKMISGEGLVGLARAFQYAGVPNVLASTWKVSDRATSELIRHFYHALLDQQLAPATALSEAQKQMQASPRWRDPYFWSGFKLIQSDY